MAYTIKEIAKLAGVSRGTIDRVIHNREGVAPAIRERVQKILKEARYEPNDAAVALKSTGRNLTIGVVIPDLSNEFYLSVYEGIRDAARYYRGYGILVEEYRMQDSTGEELVRGIDALLARQIDALAFQGIDEAAVRARLDSLPEDMPLVTFNNDLPGCRRLCFVGQDSFAAGKTAGRMMKLHLRRPGPVAIIIGRTALTHQMDRVRGFLDALDGCPLVTDIIGPIESKEQEDLSFEVTARTLASCPDLTGIYAAGGGQKSVAAALDQSGRADEVVMIGHDLLPKTVEYLNTGVVDCAIAQEPSFQGYASIEILSEYLLFHRRPVEDRLLTMVDIRLRENADFNGISCKRSRLDLPACEE